MVSNRGPRGLRSLSAGRVLSWSLASCLGLAFVGGAIWATTGALSAAPEPEPKALAAQRVQTISIKRMKSGEQQVLQLASLDTALPSKAVDLLNATAPGTVPTLQPAKQEPLAAAVAPDDADAASSALGRRFDAVAKKADLSSKKLASLLQRKTPVAKSARIASKQLIAPAPERFAAPATNGVMLAYADPSPKSDSGAIQALWQVAPLGEDLSNTPQPNGQDNALAVPGFETTPDSIDVLPGRRPRTEKAEKPEIQVEKPEMQAVKPEKPGTPIGSPLAQMFKPEKPEKPEIIKPTKPEPKLAYARPNDPGEKKNEGGGFLSKLFGGNGGSGGGITGGKGVAVYDISAAKVYMPDGSVLEAHSGIGEMADNPRYVKHKMKGPTPPHVYNLRMREKRFHGVEAIRMLPVDGKNKFGRDGFLTHSYLLRGGRAESHGCVAFKDYNKFLNAFKQGKIKQLVVVPSGGRGAGLRMAKNGTSA